MASAETRTDIRDISIVPACRDRWDAFERLMGPKGGVGGCWCMLWRQSPKQQTAQKGAGNREAIRTIFEQDIPPGLLAFDGGGPPPRGRKHCAAARIEKPSGKLTFAAHCINVDCADKFAVRSVQC